MVGVDDSSLQVVKAQLVGLVWQWAQALVILCYINQNEPGQLRQWQQIQNNYIKSDCNWQLKPGFHYPSWRPEFTGQVDGCIFWHPSTRVSKNAPEFSGRQLGMWTRAVNSGSGNRALVTLTLSWLSITPFGSPVVPDCITEKNIQCN